MSEIDCSLSKCERLSGKKAIEQLFNSSGSRSLYAFPLRLVYKSVERGKDDPRAQVMVSVPKRNLKHAVDRNRVKRQVREAYRHNKHLIADDAERKVIMAFIYLDKQLHDSDNITARVKRLIERMSERQLKR